MIHITTPKVAGPKNPAVKEYKLQDGEDGKQVVANASDFIDTDEDDPANVECSDEEEANNLSLNTV
jgi:hypothetical protein